MNRSSCCGYVVLLVSLVLSSSGLTFGGENSMVAITDIAVKSETLTVEMRASKSATVHLLELRSYEAVGSSSEFNKHEPLWTGTVSAKALASIPRFDAKRDRLYSKFLLVDAETWGPIGRPRYPSDLSALSSRDFDFPWSNGIKGISIVRDLDDAISMGVRYAADNFVIGSLLDLNNPNPEETWKVDDVEIPINVARVKALDERARAFTDAGINLTLIMLNGVPTSPDPTNPLIHPLTDLAKAPFHLGGFNVEDERGVQYYRGIIEYLSNRYSRSDKKYGWISGFIIGNEVNSHYTWYNVGEMPMEKFVEHYHRALRVTDLAARRYHPGLRTYVSLEHHWNSQFASEMESFKGKEFIDALNVLSKQEGNFPWHLAYHPYPENLFNPRVWADRTAFLSYDTPRITFKNLEVLTAYLAKEGLRYQGQPRRVILSEQGLNWDGTEEGEKTQAAGFAYAFYRISHLPGIDAFMYYKHVSSKAEFGLRLGMYAGDTEDPEERGMGRQLYLHDVFRDAGTDRWRSAFAFAKPIIGIDEWEEVLPEKDASRFEASCLALPEDEFSSVVTDLTEKMKEVRPSNSADWREEFVFEAVGYRPSIFHHPNASGDGDGVFSLVLPTVDASKRLLLKFDTAFTHESDDGVRFSVLVDGVELWSHSQKTVASQAHEIDLTAWAGKAISLTLRVNPLMNSTYDWANWVWPRIATSN